MKITRRAKIKIRLKETFAQNKDQTIRVCPICHSTIQPPELPAGDNQNAETGSHDEIIRQILNQNANTQKTIGDKIK